MTEAEQIAVLSEWTNFREKKQRHSAEIICDVLGCINFEGSRKLRGNKNNVQGFTRKYQRSGFRTTNIINKHVLSIIRAIEGDYIAHDRLYINLTF